MTYVPKDREAKVAEAAARYRRIQNLMNKLSELNLKILLEDR